MDSSFRAAGHSRGRTLLRGTHTKRIHRKRRSWSKRSDSFISPFLIAALGIVVIISRSVSAVVHPYFWAEGGAIYYADAWNQGIVAVIHSFAGYPALFPRVTSAISVLFPLKYGPWIFLVASLIAQILPVLLITSKRFAGGGRPIGLRLALAALYLALPNSYEVNLHMVSGQRQLALVAFLILISAKPNRSSQRSLDIAGLGLAGLSGPYAVLLLPVAFVLYRMRSEDKQRLRLGIVAICAVVDGLTFLLTRNVERDSYAALGAGPSVLIHMLGGQVVLGGLIGMRGYSHILQFSWNGGLIVFAGLFYVVVTVYTLIRAPLEIRLFQSYALLIFATSLLSPKVSFTKHQWSVMLAPGAGNRYFYFPIMAFLLSLLWLSANYLRGFRRRNIARGEERTWGGVIAAVVAIQLLVLVLVGIPIDWRFPSYKAPNLATYQSALYSSGGGSVSIPIIPQGVSMVLKKR